MAKFYIGGEQYSSKGKDFLAYSSVYVLCKRKVILRMCNGGILSSAVCRSLYQAVRGAELVTVWFTMKKLWQVGQQMIQISTLHVLFVAIYFCLF